MRRWLPFLVALVLGVGCAALASCASSGTKAGVPASAASDLKAQLENVRGVVDSAKCSALGGALRQVHTRIDGLPSSVDAQLQARLSDGYDRLKSKAPADCKANHDAKTPPTTQTQTTAPPTKTQTQTRTQPPVHTQTHTQPTPTQTQTTPPPVTPPPNPGGGTPPNLKTP